MIHIAPPKACIKTCFDQLHCQVKERSLRSIRSENAPDWQVAALSHWRGGSRTPPQRAEARGLSKLAVQTNKTQLCWRASQGDKTQHNSFGECWHRFRKYAQEGRNIARLLQPTEACFY